MIFIPPWLNKVDQAIDNESSSSKNWLQFSTVSNNSFPRVRRVVFRGWNTNYEMLIYSDKRSKIIKELNNNNNVEICWLFKNSQNQFRFRGSTTYGNKDENKYYWQKLSIYSKKMWGWPDPGVKYKKKC